MAPNYICKLIGRKISTRYWITSSQKIILEFPSGKMLSILGGRAFCPTSNVFSLILFQILNAKNTLLSNGPDKKERTKTQ